MKSFWSIVIIMACIYHSTMAGRRGRLKKKPNIIFILTDDQDIELGSMWAMNKTRKIFSQGAEFVNAFVTSPICCPSRSSILTGMYAHNHNTLTNNVNCSSVNWRVGPERRSYARYLSGAGYLTGHIGKYLNEYDGTYIPAGWHYWAGLVRNSRFYNYTLRHNTFYRRHSNVYQRDYFTDLITNYSLAFWRQAKTRNPDRPVLMVISHAAPHGPEDAAPQYQAAYENITSPRIPNWNFASPDKHWIVRVTAEMDKQKIAFSDMLYRKRLQTLLSVDDSIQRVYEMLKETGTLDNTYIFLSSDHGYHLGQFGLVKGKSMPYESDIRVPFYVRGPYIPKNAKIQQIVLNIDLAPTFLDIAGIKPPRSMDGVSVMKLFSRRPKNQHDKPRVRRRISHTWRDTFLVERGKIRRSTKSKSSKKQQNKSNKATFLERLCAEAKYRSPCVEGQQWHCVRVKGRQRLKKCKKGGVEQPEPVPTVAVEMCTCYRPRLPWPGRSSKSSKKEPLHDDGNLYQKEFELLRKHKRSLRSAQRRAFKQSKHYKEIARAVKQYSRRSKAKMLNKKTAQQENIVIEANLDKKLERLNARIAGIKFRLETLRGRKKKLIRIKEEKETEEYFRKKYEEFACPCPTATQPTLLRSKRPKRSNKLRERLRTGQIDQGSFIRKMNRRNMRKLHRLRSGLRSRIFGKRKRKTKKNSRRSKCAVPGMSCFHQTNYHWKTPPLWTGGEFCFCPSSSNNTYWCLRTINQHQNFLYCEFITQFLEYFDLNTDPYQLYNVVDRISPSVLYDLHHQLERLKTCKGAHSCTQYHGKPRPIIPHQTPSVNVTEQPTNSSAQTVTKKNQEQTEPTTSSLPSQPTEPSTEEAKKNRVNKNDEIEGKEERGNSSSRRNKKESHGEQEKLERRKKRKQRKQNKDLKGIEESTESQPTTRPPTIASTKINKSTNKANNSEKTGRHKKKGRPHSNVKSPLKKRERNRNKGGKSRRKDGHKNKGSSVSTAAPKPTTTKQDGFGNH